MVVQDHSGRMSDFLQSARILKLARAIADLVGSNGSEGYATIQTPHLAQGDSHRPRSSTGRKGSSESLH